MHDLLPQAAKKFPDAAATVSRRDEISYKELDLWTDTLAQEIRKQNKNHFALRTNPSESDILLLWTIWKAGKTAVLLNTRLPEKTISRQVSALPGSMPDKIATVLFTSGSTKQPKAVAHTLANHYYSALGSQTNIRLKKNDRWLLSLPLYHVSGLSVVFRCCLAGAAVALPTPEKDLLSDLRDLRITHCSLVSTQLHRLLNSHAGIRALRKMKVILLGGGPIPPGLIQKALRHKLKIYLTYGLTETASQVATSSPGDLRTGKLDGVRILPHRQVKFAPDGEILLKGKVLSPGYISDKKLKNLTDANGWFPTGDVGQKLDNEKFGIVGRKDSMFISGGENIYPEEIERCLLGHPSVTAAVVSAIPDHEFGKRPAAFLKINGTAKISSARLNATLSSTLPKYKIPVAYYRITEKAAAILGQGKINRTALHAEWKKNPKQFPAV